MLNVLIADDEEKVCQLIVNLVDWAALGLAVAGIVHNGDEGLAMVRSRRPDILITDIRMPGMDGLEFIRLAKQIDPNIEVIIISGYQYFDYAIVALRFGVSDYILKPINQEELTKTLKTLAGKRELQLRMAAKEVEINIEFDGDVKMSGASTLALMSGTIKKLEAALEQMNESAVDATLTEFWGSLLRSGRQALISCCVNLRTACTMLMLKLGLNADSLLSEHEFSSHIQLFSTAREALAYSSDTIKAALLQAMADKHITDSGPIRMAKQYISENYAKHISLEDVANIAGFSPAYFSVVFKKETGMNYLDYLTELRLSKAKELLRETNQTILRISESVGYQDIKNFTVKFRKATGINPKEFRKLYS